MKYLTVSHTTKDPVTSGREGRECFVAGYSEQTKLKHMKRIQRENHCGNACA